MGQSKDSRAQLATCKEMNWYYVQERERKLVSGQWRLVSFGRSQHLAMRSYVTSRQYLSVVSWPLLGKSREIRWCSNIIFDMHVDFSYATLAP